MDGIFPVLGAVNDDVKIVATFGNDGDKLLVAGRFTRYIVHKGHIPVRGKGLRLNKRAIHDYAEEMVQKYDVRCTSVGQTVRSLSGGNQQKVIIGRWLLTEPDVLLLDEPTRGIDVGAKYEIYQLILDLANKGKTVIMVSSEMPELLGVCDRILVMSGGRLAGEVDAKTATQEDIMRLAAKYV